MKETKAGKSYALDEGVHKVNVSGGQTATVNVSDAPQNDPADMLVAKVDSETGKASPLGAGTLAGAEFTVKYYDGFYTQDNLPEKATRTWILKTDAKGRTSLLGAQNKPDTYFVSGDSLYLSTDGYATLPIGTISVQETKAPQGYLLSDSSVHIQQITSNTTTERVTTFVEPSEDAPTVREQVKRGDIAFNKVHGEDMTGLANVPFMITSKTTGESHIAITDANGILTTESSACPHTQNTNGNDAALNADGTLEESKLSIDNGLWFSGSKDAQVPADDGKGALPYDTYTFEELRCASNDSLNLVKFEVTVSRDAYTIDRGTVDDNPIEIGTTATDAADGNHKLLASNQAEIVDTVTYKGLKKGLEYELSGTLMDAETGEALKGADGKEITASAKFTPQAQDGSQDVTFTFDASALGGAKTVVFEKLFVDGTLIGSHEDPTDKDQTVEISPSLKTTAATIQGSKVVKPEDEVAIVDTVHLKGLRPGQSYTLTASINKKADGTQLTLTDVKDASTLTGNGVQKGSDSAGSSSDLSKALVDVTGTGSFVNIPEGAKLSKNEDGTYTLTVPGASKDAADIVTKLSGGQVKLVPSESSDKADGAGTTTDTESIGKDSTLGTYEVIANGQVRFTPAVSDLDVDVPMVFKASDVAGQQAVVFESLQRETDGKEISKETDLEDTDQTIDIENTPEGKNLEQTGNWVLYAAIAAGVAACIAAIFLIFRKRKI